jgi:Ca2+-binding RTX toxin-like protein
LRETISGIENVVGSSYRDFLSAEGNQANLIIGGAGNDNLSGGGGNDVLRGGPGDDSLWGGAGLDTADYSDRGTPVRVALNVDTNVTSIRAYVNNAYEDDLHEIESLTGGAGADTFLGDSLANVLTGNAGNDVLTGYAGNDTLLGGAGLDQLTGGAGLDYFRFNTTPNTATNRDLIVDFVHGQDRIQLENAVFTKLGSAATAHTLGSAFFWAGQAANDLNDYIVYNRATGALFYDVNGKAAGGSFLLAYLQNKPLLTASDFLVV